MNKILDIKAKQDCKEDWVQPLQVADDKIAYRETKLLAEWGWDQKLGPFNDRQFVLSYYPC